MTPLLTFFFGLLLLGLFAWYFSTESGRPQALARGGPDAAAGPLLPRFGHPSARKRSDSGSICAAAHPFLLQLVPRTAGRSLPTCSSRRSRSSASASTSSAWQAGHRAAGNVPHPRPDSGLDPAQIQSAEEQLQQVAKLEFAEVHRDSDSLLPQIEKGEAIVPPGFEIKEYSPERETAKPVVMKLLVKKTADLTGDHVTKAYAFFDNHGYAVGLALDGEGAKQFFDLTTALAPYHGRLAILLDGKVQTAPQVNEPIPDGHATISGNYKEKEVRELASVLENPLRTPVTIEETRSVSRPWGRTRSEAASSRASAAWCS